MAESAHAAIANSKRYGDYFLRQTEKTVTLAEMAENFVDYDVVFFG